MHCNTFVIRTSVEHYVPRLTGTPIRRSILICNILTNIGADWVFSAMIDHGLNLAICPYSYVSIDVPPPFAPSLPDAIQY